MVAVILFLLAVVAAHAQEWRVEDPEARVFAEQKETITNFPYHVCAAQTTVGAYSFASNISNLGGGRYCFTLKVANCSDRCCKTDLNKIEFDVNANCIVSPLPSIEVTINGVRPTITPGFSLPLDGPQGSAMFRIPSLTLNTSTAANNLVCITLKPNRYNKGCTTLEEFCKPPPGVAPGTCAVAFVNAVRNCCPTSNSSLFFPPPPSPPSPWPPSPRPPSPAPPPPCRSCLNLTFDAGSPVLRPFTLNSSICAAIQANISANINALTSSLGVTMASSFSPSGCSDKSISVCGTFLSKAEAAKLSQSVSLDQEAERWLEAALGGDICKPELTGYTVKLSSSPSGPCISVQASKSCRITNPFFNCSCITTPGLTPFIVSPRYTTVNKATTTQYCFSFDTIPGLSSLVPVCGSVDTLYKVEIYADPTLSSSVESITAIPGGSSAWSTAKNIYDSSWNGNAIKATPINWNINQARGGRLCIELKKPVTLDQFCLGDDGQLSGQCFLSLFSGNNRCCPIYRTGAP